MKRIRLFRTRSSLSCWRQRKPADYVTNDKDTLAGLSDAQIAAAAEDAKDRKVEGYVIPLQNTTQQPDLADAYPARDAPDNL